MGRGPAWSHRGAVWLRMCRGSPYLAGRDKAQLLPAALMEQKGRRKWSHSPCSPSLTLCPGHQVTILYGPGSHPEANSRAP